MQVIKSSTNRDEAYALNPPLPEQAPPPPEQAPLPPEPSRVQPPPPPPPEPSRVQPPPPPPVNYTPAPARPMLGSRCDYGLCDNTSSITSGGANIQFSSPSKSVYGRPDVNAMDTDAARWGLAAHLKRKLGIHYATQAGMNADFDAADVQETTYTPEFQAKYHALLQQFPPHQAAAIARQQLAAAGGMGLGYSNTPTNIADTTNAGAAAVEANARAALNARGGGMSAFDRLSPWFTPAVGFKPAVGGGVNMFMNAPSGPEPITPKTPEEAMRLLAFGGNTSAYAVWLAQLNHAQAEVNRLKVEREKAAAQNIKDKVSILKGENTNGSREDVAQIKAATAAAATAAKVVADAARLEELKARRVAEYGATPAPIPVVPNLLLPKR